MEYNPQTPSAVFLGPSLPLAAARQRLAANYYPPARTGDIYRLLGCGVRTIVLIDGLFYQETAVWPREILAALDNGIQVIGAASMGALRAAELYAYGMIGQGAIFAWYRDGIINGDDEVALLHADEAHDFRPLSEPLVNIRYNLWQAVRQKLISATQATDLIAYAKRHCYTERSYPALWCSPPVQSWPRQTREHLIQFIQQHAVNLKQQDAITALGYCAKDAVPLTIQTNDPPAVAPRAPNRDRYYRLTSCKHRGFLDRQGRLVRGEALLAEVLQDAELVQRLRPEIVKNHFLLLAARQKATRCPPDYLATYSQSWQREHHNAGAEHWLRSNGLTKPEYQTTLAERALIRCFVEQETSAANSNFQPYCQWAATLLAGQNQPEEDAVPQLMEIAEIYCLAVWARENGIACSPPQMNALIEKWEEACGITDRENWLKQAAVPETFYRLLLSEWATVSWLVAKGPTYFGYPAWSFEAALIQELQVTGQAAHIVERIP